MTNQNSCFEYSDDGRPCSFYILSICLESPGFLSRSQVRSHRTSLEITFRIQSFNFTAEQTAIKGSDNFPEVIDLDSQQQNQDQIISPSLKSCSSQSLNHSFVLDYFLFHVSYSWSLFSPILTALLDFFFARLHTCQWLG